MVDLKRALVDRRYAARAFWQERLEKYEAKLGRGNRDDDEVRKDIAHCLARIRSAENLPPTWY